MRVWVKGMPGADETEVVGGTITEVREGDAGLFLRARNRPERWLRIVPHEKGWGFGALCFSFISVDVFVLEGDEAVGRWFLRLGEVGSAPNAS